MPFATRPRLFRSRLLIPLVLVLAGLGGCQSSRPNFSFQPVPGRARAVAVLPLAVAKDAALTPGASAAVPTDALPTVWKPHRALRQPQARPTMAVIKNIAPASISPVRHAAAYQRALLGRPHATAEVGLGTTVLGVLGLVVLPIALIGLAISGGGLVWAIVTGAAALAVLVAYLNPFG